MPLERPLDDPSILDAGVVAAALGTDPQSGLSAKEAATRLARDGSNELRAAARVPTWRRVLAQFQDPLVYLLLAAVIVAFAAWLIEGRHGWPVDAIVIGLVVIVNGALGYAQGGRDRGRPRDGCGDAANARHLPPGRPDRRHA